MNRNSRFLIVRNPTAGWRRQRVYRDYIEALRATGAQIEEVDTSGPGDATRIAREAKAALSGIIAAGGDGTINEVVNGLIVRDTPIPLGVFPMGTANVYAAEVGLPFEPGALATCLVAGHMRDLQLGRIDPLDRDSLDHDPLNQPDCEGRYFVLMAGAGFDAQVVAKIDPATKRKIGKGAYVIETIDTFVRADADCPILRINGREIATGSAIVVNARYYAGRFVLSKSASPFSPGMDLCLFHKTGRLATLGYLIRVGLGLIETSPVYSTQPVTTFDIVGPAGAAIQADGDIIAHAPVRISMAQSMLPAIVPAS